jgi:hypothetical protein
VAAAGTTDPKAEIGTTPTTVAASGTEPTKQSLASPVFLQFEDEIRKCHAQVGNSTQEVIVSAAKCGLLLMVGKVVTGHGGFENWCEQACFTFSKMTRSNYLRFGGKLLEVGNSKTVLLLETTVDAQGKLASFHFHEEVLRKLIKDESQGRSLTQLYAAWKITKQRPNTTTAKPVSKAATLTIKQWVATLDGIPSVFDSLASEEKSTIISKLEQLLQTLKTNHQHEANK